MPSVCVRDAEWPTYVGLSQKERNRVIRLDMICQEIDRNPNKRAAMAEAAATYAHERGMSEASIRMAYYRWLEGDRNWLCLANTGRVERATMAKKLADQYRAYAERNQRSSRSAYEQFLRDIRAGKAFPGIGDWRAMWAVTHPHNPAPAQCPADFVPAGVTYRHMQRVGGLTRYEIKAARIGQKAALSFAPSVYSTRANLPVGAIFEFDDLTHDVIIDAGHMKGVRPQEFACLDVASAYKCAWGIKPEIPGDDGKRERLREREMLYLAAYVLTEIGYRPEGTIWIVEHGTAAIRQPMRNIIRTLTHEAITFQDSGILGEQVHRGLFPGAGSGVPGIKAHLESSFNLVHNVAASLPAQTGSNSRETKPEQLYGLEKYHADLMKATANLPEETKRQLMLPVMRLGDFNEAMASVYRIIHDSREHDLEGWDAAGNVVHCFRLSPAQPWTSIANAMAAVKDPAKKAALDGAIRNLAERREMKMSRGDVWNRDSGKLMKLDHWAVPALLSGDDRCIRKDRLTRRHEIAFEDAYFGPGIHRFYPICISPEGRKEVLSDRRDYAFILTPYNPARIYVCEPDSLACIGFAERMKPGCRMDADSMHRLMGHRDEIIHMLNEPIQARHQDDADAREAMIAHNDRVIAAAKAGGPAPADAARMLADEGTTDEMLEGAGKSTAQSAVATGAPGRHARPT
jgi:hypothetical protein